MKNKKKKKRTRTFVNGRVELETKAKKPEPTLGTDGSTLVVAMATVADESVRAVTLLINLVAASPQRHLQDGCRGAWRS